MGASLRKTSVPLPRRRLLLCPAAALIGWLLISGGPATADDHHARRIVELGWEDHFQSDSGWRCERWQVDRPDHQPASNFGPQGGVFTVATPQRAMAWTRTTNPIWVANFPFLQMDYEIVGGPEDADYPVILLSDDSTGPVTPGAPNPENPLASGSQAGLGSPAPGPHQRTVDLRKHFHSDRIGRITLFVRSGKEPTSLIVRKLAFWASDPREAALFVPQTRQSPALLPSDESAAAGPANRWQPVPLPARGGISAHWLCRAFDTATAWPANGSLTQDGVLFQLADEDQAAVATGVPEIESLEFAGRWRGRELALLLGTRVFGSDRPWFGRASAPPRGALTSPHDLVVVLEYKDGTSRSCFPWSARRQEWSLEKLPQLYVVPLEPNRLLCRFSVVDRMNFGQAFVLAASINTSPQPVFATPATGTRRAPSKRQAKPRPAPTRWVKEQPLLTIENAWLHLIADVQAGFRLHALRIVPLDRTLVANEESAPLLEVLDEHGRVMPLTLRDLQASRTSSGATFDLAWSAGDPSGRREIHLRVEVEDDGGIILKPTARNETNSPWKLGLIYPQLRRCRVAPNPDDAYYLLGTRSTLLGREPIAVELPYGGEFPLQLMDVFARQAGGGLGLLVADRQLHPKVFRFRHDADGADLSVHFPRLEVPPEGQVTLPPAVLFAHLGDWQEAFERYRAWAREGLAARPRPSVAALFHCRRDYPLGGTGYLFDRQRKRYTPEALIDESRRSFGGMDMIDISGWAYNEAAGRVGDYLTNDLGGLDELRQAIERAHQQGVKVGLYFEGYLIDRRCGLAEDGLPGWQLVGGDGKPRWWDGKMEFFACPGVAAWRKQLARMIAEVAHRTAADAVYLDQFGFAGQDKACWSPEHGHPVPSNPLAEEARMLRAVREALDQRCANCAIYVEQVPCDAAMGLVDAGFDHGMASRVAGCHVTRLPLSRYVFGEIPVMEMISSGIRPTPVSVEDLHLCFFHGMGVWLKGRGDSWYSAEFRRTAQCSYRILRAHADAFRSPDCLPLVPTLQANLYANRFATEKKIILTLYNAAYNDVRGDLIQAPLPKGWQVFDLWRDCPAELRRDGNQVILRGVVQPHSAGAFLLAPCLPTEP